jgi:hypothetical protein
MKMPKTLLAMVCCFGVLPVFAQPGAGSPTGLNFGGGMAKIFGDNSAFTADLVLQTTPSGAAPMNMHGKTASLDGKTRFEVNMAEKDGPITAEQLAQMKAMGMDMSQMILLTRPDKKITYMVLPNMKASVENPITDTESLKSPSDFKMETTELGKETVDGHPCIKNKVVITDDKGKKHESTVWNATDLNKFPVKIETDESGDKATMLFQNVKLSKPDASLFDPPADYKSYSGMMAMMQEMMMKQMGGAGKGQ